jgi:hypothetical protein
MLQIDTEKSALLWTRATDFVAYVESMIRNSDGFSSFEAEKGS